MMIDSWALVSAPFPRLDHGPRRRRSLPKPDCEKSSRVQHLRQQKYTAYIMESNTQKRQPPIHES